MITTYLYVLINAIRTPFQGGFLVRAAPRAEALGCSLSALRAIGAGPRKCPNSRESERDRPIGRTVGGECREALRERGERSLVRRVVSGQTLRAQNGEHECPFDACRVRRAPMGDGDAGSWRFSTGKRLSGVCTVSDTQTGRAIGSLKREVTIPEPPADGNADPFDLGTLTLEVKSTLKSPK